jgi:nucleotide-binding universal stress UspA family protein
MAFKDLLVHVDRSVRCAARLDIAVRLAVPHGAHLTGLYVVPPPERPAVTEAPAEGLPPETAPPTGPTAEEDAMEAENLFRGHTAHSGLAVDWRRAGGAVGESVCRHALSADFTVIGQTPPEDAAAPVFRDLAERLIFASGRPVLVVPYAGAFPAVGDQVVVAWNGGREAARAVNDALPILRRASRVIVLTVITEGTATAGSEESGAAIASHLGRHGVKVEAAQVVARDIEAGDVILSRLADVAADLLVMGAYGHSRIREIVLGGVTRHILESMTVPVLMSH